METEIILRGYPSRKRFAEWQRANMLSADQLPSLTDEQVERARKLRITEKGFAIALKAGEFARERSFVEMERVAKCIHQVIRKHDPQSDLATLVWDFNEGRFDYVVVHRNGSMVIPEATYSIPGEMIDEVILGHEGAELKLVTYVARDLELLAS